jgi:NAD(P)-dependent dehydrogenase (short-subunit alcohol dehydrogenase family)
MLSGKVAVITGGARGIGRAIALKFAEAGARTVIVDLRDDQGADAGSAIAKKGHEALFIKCDVSDANQVHRMVSQVIDRFGIVDIFVNNAGLAGGPPRSIVDISEGEWDKMIDVNLKGTFLCCREIVPYMKEKGHGKIVNVASLAAVSPPGSVVHYVASKAGVIGMTLDLALELAPFNICVNAILPGAIRTDIWNDVVPPGVDPEFIFSEMAKAFPMGRVGTPEDIAGAALYLASDLSGYVTGDRIIVAGGGPLVKRI